MRRFLLPVLLAALALAGCGRSRPELAVLPGAESELREAKRAFDDGNNVRAVELLGAFVQAHPGSNKLDEALLLLGLAHQRTGENLVAFEDFERLIRDFPQSPMREQAEFERARCHMSEAPGPAYDPEHTEIALSLYRGYLVRYPQGTYAEEARKGVSAALERLAMKAFLNAETYRKLGRPPAERIYLEKALDTKPDFERAGEALARLARANARLGKDEEARAAWRRLLEFATEERVRRDSGLGALRREAEAGLRGTPAATPDTGSAR